ncbi:hypothetical protein BGZ96_006963 [Linnemannia gamsii]|uniref:Uncharacterized protein n=1 Tax=Linnemannia gamsii TaxID=64522 RepID=A0ABQ7K2L9_9FUNG|nr:hypothetical protein BGZ96_006963 [Linnemannia gamsii]
MDYQPSDRRKREHNRHDTFYIESRRSSCDDYMDNNLYNKRRRRSYVDCDEFYNTNSSTEMIDVLTSRRMRILLHEKPWHSRINPHTALTKANAATLSIKDQKELQEFKEEQRNIQLQMADEALNEWKKWCFSHSDQSDTSLSLKKLVDFIDSKVIPQENAILRQLAHDNRIPISGVESLLLPLLRHLRQKEEEGLTKKKFLSNRQQLPLTVSIRSGSQSSPDLPLSKSNDPPPSFRSSRPGRSGYITVSDQAIPKVDLETEEGEEEEEEEDEVSPWTSIKSFRDRTPEGVSSSSAVLDDVSCLENSLETVSTISAEVESLREAASMPTIDFSESNPYLLTDSFFARLRKDQAKAERLGLNGTLYNPRLVEVLKEHVQLVQTLSIHMSNRVISLVPTCLAKNTVVFKGTAAPNPLTSDTPLQTPSSISISFPVGSKKIHVGGTPGTVDQDILQSNAPSIRIDQDQDARLREQIRMACRDMDMQAVEPLTPLSNKIEANYQNNSQVDKMKADENSVWLAWHRWKVGNDGSFSLEELVKRIGLDRMALELQNYAQKV